MVLLPIVWMPGETAARSCTSDPPDQNARVQLPGRRGSARAAAEARTATPSAAASTSTGSRPFLRAVK